MKLYLGIFLATFSLQSLAFTTESIFSLNSETGSFNEVFEDGETIMITLEITKLPMPDFSELVKMEKDMKCIGWNGGTSPDDPGTCMGYRETGKFRVSTPVNSFALFSVTETTEDLKTGEVRTRKLPPLRSAFYSTYFKLLDRPVVPDDLDFNAYMEGADLFGCAAKDFFVTLPVLHNDPVHLGICQKLRGKVELKRRGGEYYLAFGGKLIVTNSVHAFWRVQDSPRTNYVLKSLWESKFQEYEISYR